MTQETTPQQASQEEDIEKLFDEAASGGESASSEEADKQDSTAAESKQDGEGEANGTPDLDLSQNTVGEDATDKDASSKTEGEEPPEKTEAKPDWRASLPEEARAEIEKIEAEQRTKDEELKKLRHAARSDAGRVAALTRQMEDLRRKVTEGTTSQRADAQAVLDDLATKYPEIAAAVAAVRDEGKQKQQSTEQLAQKLAEEQALKAQAEREAAVEAAHAGWKQTIRTPVFREWLGQQSQEIKSLALSDEPDHAIHLLNAYRESVPATSDVSKDAVKDAGKDATQDKPASKTAAEIKAEREKKLEASVGVQTKQAARETTTDAGGDIDALFDAEARRRERNTRKQN